MVTVQYSLKKGFEGGFSLFCGKGTMGNGTTACGEENNIFADRGDKGSICTLRVAPNWYEYRGKKS
jgi:hypothetical protein